MITATAIILSVALGLFVLAAAVAMLRLFLGPTALDRAVAVDVVSAAVIGIIIVMVAWRGRTDLMVLLIIFTLTAFFSSVTVARFGVGSAIRRYRRQVEHASPERAGGAQQQEVQQQEAQQKARQHSEPQQGGPQQGAQGSAQPSASSSGQEHSTRGEERQ